MIAEDSTEPVVRHEVRAETVGDFADHTRMNRSGRYSLRTLEMPIRVWTRLRHHVPVRRASLPTAQHERVRPEFESAAHRAEFARHLRDRYLPLKFAYTATAAITHSRLSQSIGYQQVIGPVDAEAKALLAEAPIAVGRGQFAEIGPGAGVHSGELLRVLAESQATPSRYLALDFSSTLLEMALDHLAASAARPANMSRDLWDIEAGPTEHIAEWRAEGEPVVLCFLGNTLGNVEHPQQVLTHLAHSVRTGDVLMVSVTLRSNHRDENEVLAPYRNSVFRSAALESFHLAGIDPDDLSFTVSYDDGAVVAMAESANPISFDGITIGPGERIRCFLSRRFTVEQVRTLLEESGWLVLRETDDSDHLVVIATRK